MARAPIFISVQGGRLIGGDAYAAQQISELPDGDYFARFSKLTRAGRDEREGMRGLWFAGLKLLSDNTDDPRYDTPEKAYHNIRIDLGFSRPRYRRDGSVEMVPTSTADDNMDDEEMAVLQEKAQEFWMRREGWDPWESWKAEQDAKKGNQR